MIIWKKKQKQNLTPQKTPYFYAKKYLTPHLASAKKNGLLRTLRYPWATPGWPLGDPWVTPGWPLGDPWANQSSPWANLIAEYQKHELSGPGGKVQTPKKDLGLVNPKP